MENWPELFDGLYLPVGPGSVCKQNNCNLSIEIDPKGTPAVAEVTDGVPGETASGRRILRRRIPAKCAGTPVRSLSLSEEFDGFTREKVGFCDLWVGIPDAVEDFGGETKQVGHIGEEPGVPGHAIQEPGIFVLHFSLNTAVAEGGVLFCGRDGWPDLRRRAEAGGSHAEGFVDFAVCPGLQGVTGADFEGFAEQDETGIGVFGAGSWLGFERNLQAGLHEFERRGKGAEELDVAGKAGAVGQQMAELDTVCGVGGGAADNEAGEHLAEERVEVKETALVELHGHGGSGDDFADAGQIEDGFRGYSGRRLLIGEAAACVAEFDFTAGQNAEGAAWEGAIGDGLVEGSVDGGKSAAGSGLRG